MLHLIAEAAAVAPPDPVVVRVGEWGEWFGPIFVLVASLVLDWSALGSVAIRDRIAAAGYYTAALSMISIFHWEATVQGWFGASPSWQLAGSALSFFMHAGLVIAMVGSRFKWSKGMAKKIREWMHMEHADSSANRINSTLMSWASAAAASSVLARGPLANFVHFVAQVLTGAWAVLTNAGVHGLGG